MNFEQSRLVLWGKALKDCPVKLLEGEPRMRVPGTEVYFISGYDVESMSFVLVKRDDPMESIMAGLSDIYPIAQTIAVVGNVTPLFFMDEQNQRVYCSPNVRDLDDLSVEVRTMRLSNFLNLLPFSGEFAVVRYPYMNGLFVGQLEYREDGMYNVNDVYKVSDDKESVEPFRVSKFIVSMDDIVTHDSMDNEVIAGIYAQTRQLPNEGKEDSHE